jgi:polyhydroxyalkanoate synthase
MAGSQRSRLKAQAEATGSVSTTSKTGVVKGDASKGAAKASDAAKAGPVARKRAGTVAAKTTRAASTASPRKPAAPKVSAQVEAVQAAASSAASASPTQAADAGHAPSSGARHAVESPFAAFMPTGPLGQMGQMGDMGKQLAPWLASVGDAWAKTMSKSGLPMGDLPLNGGLNGGLGGLKMPDLQGAVPPPFADAMQHAGGAVKAMESMGQSLGATVNSLAGLSVPPDTLKSVQEDYVQQATRLWNQALEKPDAIEVKDKRFAAPAWTSNPMSAFMASLYLLNARTLQTLADNLQGDEKARQRVRFAVQQWADAASPSNFLALNPEALQKAVETRGESLTQGIQHLMHDVRQGHLSQTDETVFEVGKNVATSEGVVVYENPYFQLIEYKPSTGKVHEVPFLFVPPFINKFYILDLQPENSLVRYLVNQGHRVFLVSWVNADESLSKTTWDDYVEEGTIRAINVTREIAGSEQVNALGFCVGGTMLATAAATLASRNQKPLASLTLLTAFLDFSNTGIMNVFVDEAMVRLREMTMGPESPKAGGLMKGADLAATFSFLRPNDLVWNYVVGNYLKGETPPPFDLLYWNGDSTNLPGPLYTWYLRHTYLENNLKKPGAVKVGGLPLDLRKLDMPTFIYGSREDHIVPWDSAYLSTQIVSGDKTFVLGASGHIAGVINPPEKKKRSFWTSPRQARGLPATAKEWMAQAEEHPGSWWPTWAEWLARHAGDMVPAPKHAGSREHRPIEPAPGRYVLRKA